MVKEEEGGGSGVEGGGGSLLIVQRRDYPWRITLWGGGEKKVGNLKKVSD